MAKRPFDIHQMLARIRHEVKQFADAAMFDLADQGFATPFHQLAACVISIRTLDEVSLPAAIRLFKAAPTPEKISRLSARKIAALIRPASFYEAKAYNIRDMAKRVVEEFDGKLPCDYDVILRFAELGPNAQISRLVLRAAPRRSASTFTCTVSPTAGDTSAQQSRKAHEKRSRKSCQGNTGWKSIDCWCRLENTSAPADYRSAQPARFSNTVDRSA